MASWTGTMTTRSPRQWTGSSPTPGAFMTCMATSAIGGNRMVLFLLPRSGTSTYKVTGSERLGLFVSRTLSGFRALEQHVTRAVLPARGTGKDFAMGKNRFANEFFSRIVRRRSIAVAAELAEIVTRHHDDIDPLDLVEDVIDDADACWALNLNHDQNVVVGIGGVPLAPEGCGLVAAGAATTP